MKRQFLALSCCISMTALSFGQELLPLAIRQKEEIKASSWVKETPFEPIKVKEIGNTIKALAINPRNSAEIVVAPTDSGLWLSRNGGETFTPLCPTLPTHSISALAVDWNSQRLCVATPYGLFTSTDMGKTVQFSGLAAVQQITSIVINPQKPNEIIIGALGNTYRGDEKRGIFKSTDGGKTWSQKLFIDTRTGISQIISTAGGNTLYAAAWEINSTPSDLSPYGAGSGIYKSDDSGNTWSKVSNNGFLKGNTIGRIGLTAYDAQTLYAVVDNRSTKRREASNSVQKISKIHLSAQDFDGMSKPDFLALDNERLNVFLYNTGLDKKYRAQNLKDMIAADVTSPARLLNYLGVSAQEVVGAEVYLSTNGGTSWQKTNAQPLTDVYYQNGDLFGGISVDLQNKNHLLIGGYPLLESFDGGKNWRSKRPMNLDNAYYQIYQQQGTLFCTTAYGLEVSYDGGKSWATKNVAGAMAFTRIGYDKAKKIPYLLSAQGTLYNENAHWSSLRIPLNAILFGNDSYAAQDYGNFSTYDEGRAQFYPLGSLFYGENKAPLRLGKKAPLLISPQNKDIIYAGSNKLHISMDKGRNWRTISEDVTNGNKQGNKAYGTIASIAESPFMFGLLYTGSDDGMIYASENGGVSWKQVYNAFPRPLKVNNLIASKHQRNRVIATLVSNDENDTESFIFLSNDNGKSWNDIHSNLPQSRVNVLREDPKNSQVLYLGTDNGLYISFNLGESWQPFTKGLPETGFSDIYIDETTGDMYAASLGNGVYRTSIKMMQELKVAITSQDFYPLETPISIAYSSNWGNALSQWEEPAKPSVYFYGFASKENLKIEVRIMKGRIKLQSFTFKTNKGFNYIPYDLTLSEEGKTAYEKSLQKIFIPTAPDGNAYLPKGRYTVVFETPDGFDEERTLDVY